MDCFSRLHLFRSTIWIPTTDQAWVSNNGRKINLKNDVVICVTTLENRLMHALAVDELNLRYDISVRSCPHGSKIPRESLPSKWRRHINTWLNPFYRPFNIFGQDLLGAVKIDRRRHCYAPLRINDGYNLNVPYFLVECARCIEKYGLCHNDIFKDIRNSIKLSQLKTLVTSGGEFHFDVGQDVLEVAMLLKWFLERMPEGLFTKALEFHVVNATEYGIEERVKFLGHMVKVLPRINREALYMVLSLLRRIAYSQGNNIKSSELNDIFAPVLFRARWIVSSKAMGIIKDLINYFPTIFTLKVKQLDNIYKQMSANYPRKLNDSLQRRIHQCHCDESDIPVSMRILTSEMRSYDAFKITLHRQLNFRRKLTDDFFDPHYHNHSDRNIREKEVYRKRDEDTTALDIQLSPMASASQTKAEPEKSFSAATALVNQTGETKRAVTDCSRQTGTDGSNECQKTETVVQIEEDSSNASKISIQKLTDTLPEPGFETPSVSQTIPKIEDNPINDPLTSHEISVQMVTGSLPESGFKPNTVGQAAATDRFNGDGDRKSLKANVASLTKTGTTAKIKDAEVSNPVFELREMASLSQALHGGDSKVKVAQKVAEIESRERATWKAKTNTVSDISKTGKKPAKKVTICLPDSGFKVKEKDSVLQTGKPPDGGKRRSLKPIIKVPHKVADQDIELKELSPKHRPAKSARAKTTAI